MKYINFLLIPLLASLLLAQLEGIEAAEPSEPIAREEQVRLAEDFVTRYAVVVGSEETSTATERFAAKELALFLQKITGATFPVVKEDECDGTGIYVGQTQRAVGIGVDFGKNVCKYGIGETENFKRVRSHNNMVF